jgi:hypothetical protein
VKGIGFMEEKQNHAAKGQMVALMQAGHSWQESRSVGQQPTASCKKYGSKAKRACKMAGMDTPPNCANLCSNGAYDYCHAAPGTPSHIVQQALQNRFGVVVSISHLNATRAALGLLSRATPLREKNQRRTQAANRSGWPEQAASYS